MHAPHDDSGAMLTGVKRIAVIFVVGGCVVIGSCGSTKKEAVVVRVGENSITAAAVDHWIKIESVTSHGGAGATKPLPKGVLPVPPDYAACIAYLISQAPSSARPTRQEARVRCAVEYKALKETILRILINYYWDAGESAEQGVNVTEAEITRYLKQMYPHPGEFRTHLKVTGETRADDRLLVRSKLLRAKLVARSAQDTHNQAERVRAVTRSIAEETAKWTRRTSCKPGYVVPACKQYHGPQT